MGSGSSVEALLAAYYALPVTASPWEFVEGHGNWGLDEGDSARADELAREIVALRPVPREGEDDWQFYGREGASRAAGEQTATAGPEPKPGRRTLASVNREHEGVWRVERTGAYMCPYRVVHVPSGKATACTGIMTLDAAERLMDESRLDDRSYFRLPEE